MEASALKECVPLSRIAEQFSIELQGKACPFEDCKGSHSFKVYQDRRFKCFKCGRHGSGFDLLIHGGVAKDFKEAYRLLNQKFGNSQDSRQYRSRVQELREIFRTYEEAAVNHWDTVSQYCSQRGWANVLRLYPVGYAPHPHYLREQGFSTQTLESLGLIQGTGELYRNHILWPVKNAAGDVVHLCGRALDPEATVRWLSSPGKPPISNYLYGIESLESQEYGILAEGISDTYSLLELGVPAIGTFGINVSLLHHTETLRNLSHLIAFYDRDRYPVGHPKEGQMISWIQMLPNLIDLACTLKVPMFCCRVPDWPGTKDLNDYLVSIDYSQDTFRQYCHDTAIPIHDMALEVWGPYVQEHSYLWRLHAALPNPTSLERFKQHIESQWGSWDQYLLDQHRP
jgi:hypothetical protein